VLRCFLKLISPTIARAQLRLITMKLTGGRAGCVAWSRGTWIWPARGSGELFSPLRPSFGDFEVQQNFRARGGSFDKESGCLRAASAVQQSDRRSSSAFRRRRLPVVMVQLSQKQPCLTRELAARMNVQPPQLLLLEPLDFVSMPRHRSTSKTWSRTYSTSIRSASGQLRQFHFCKSFPLLG
jgi:hypothetical protein